MKVDILLCSVFTFVWLATPLSSQKQIPIELDPSNLCRGKSRVIGLSVPKDGTPTVTHQVGRDGVIICNGLQGSSKSSTCHIDTVHSGSKDLKSRESMGVAVDDTLTLSCPGQTSCSITMCD